MFNSQRIKQGIDGKLIVRFARDSFAYKRRVSKCVCRITTGGSRIERQFGGPGVAAVTKDVLPGPIVGAPVASGQMPEV